MKRLILYCLGMFILAASARAQVITGFGSSAVNPLDDQLGTWTISIGSLNASVTNVSNSSGGIAALLNTPILISNNRILTLQGTLDGTVPATTHFRITLYDVDYDALTADYSWSDFNAGAKVSSALSTNAAFDGTVNAWALKLYGFSGETVSFTFNELAAIPEPSASPLVIAGLFSLALYKSRNSSLLKRLSV